MAYYQAGQTVTTNLGSFVGSGNFLAATVSAADNSGGLVAPPDGHVDASVTLVYDYIVPVVLPTVPTGSLTLKLVGSLPSNATCQASAAQLSAGTVVGGLVAFGTTLHATNTGGPYAMTETKFLPATLSADGRELNSLTTRCAGILGNGSGYGMCNSCNPGALGALKH
jgi:hypothetical protein